MTRFRFACCALAIALALGSAGARAQLTLDEPVGAEITVGSKPGNPLYDMPEGQTLISPFGERPVFSPDGKKIAFIADSYGDAFECDIANGRIKNLTSHMAHRGFLRIHYLNDGSYLLLGPRLRGKTMAETRESHIEMFWLNAAADQPPVALGPKVFEGIATSRESNKVAWRDTGEMTGPEIPALRQADVVVEGRTARLENVTEIARITDCGVEPQDYLPGDKALTLPCYHAGDYPGGYATEVMSIDLASKAITRYPTPRGMYGEIEGLFPDGKRALIECASDRSAGMDLCILELKAKSPRYTRLTHIQDYGRWKYGNPVVSPDGRWIASSIGPADVPEAGMALGIVLIDLEAASARK